MMRMRWIFFICFLNISFLLVSRDDDENDRGITKSESSFEPDRFECVFFFCGIELAVETIPSEEKNNDSDLTKIEDGDEEKINSIQCDNCQESFLTSEQFNQHRLYQCSFLTGSLLS